MRARALTDGGGAGAERWTRTDYVRWGGGGGGGIQDRGSNENNRSCNVSPVGRQSRYYVPGSERDDGPTVADIC